MVMVARFPITSSATGTRIVRTAATKKIVAIVTQQKEGWKNDFKALN